jgi:hypothetical protein
LIFAAEKNRLNPYATTFCLSLLLSWLGVSTDNLINHDAVHFMDAAKAFLREGAGASFHVYKWPFYSWFVAIVHNVLWFDYIEQTAHLINALFITATCLLFIRIYSEVTHGSGKLWVAAVLILTLVGINKYRADIMRDFAYWCFFLSAFYCLLVYYKRPNWRAAFGWQIFMLFAFFARIEALVIMALGPLALMLENTTLKRRLIKILPLYGLYFVGLLCLILALLLVDVSNLNIQVGRLPDVLRFLDIDGWFASYDKAVNKIAEIFWYEGDHLDKYYGVLAVLYATMLATYVLVRIAGCIGFPYFAVLLYGASKRYVVNSDYNKIIFYFISFLFVFFFAYKVIGSVLTPRYTTSLVLMLLLLLGQMVERILPNINKSKHRKKIVPAIVIFLFINTADAVISTQGSKKDYVLEAGYWVEKNIDNSVPVYSNYYKALYYTDRGRSFQNSMEFEQLIDRIKQRDLEAGACLIFKVDNEQSETYSQQLDKLVSEGAIEYLAEFSNKSKDRAVIYRLQ